jgi:hypothetical protein
VAGSIPRLSSDFLKPSSRVTFAAACCNCSMCPPRIVPVARLSDIGLERALKKFSQCSRSDPCAYASALYFRHSAFHGDLVWTKLARSRRNARR